jgi:hypothetical protein
MNKNELKTFTGKKTSFEQDQLMKSSPGKQLNLALELRSFPTMLSKTGEIFSNLGKTSTNVEITDKNKVVVFSVLFLVFL